MKFDSVLLITAVLVLQYEGSAAAVGEHGGDFSHEDIKGYFGNVVKKPIKGHNYDIVDIWEHHPSTLASPTPELLPLRAGLPTDHKHQHDVRFTAFAEQFKLRLTRNPWLVRRGLLMETLGRNGSVVASKEVRNNCFYYGEVLSHNSTSVAISKCDGMEGIISYGEHDIFIKPLRSDHADRYRRTRRDSVHPHLVYRRSVNESSDPAAEFCDPPPPMVNPETGLTVVDEMIAALRGKILPSSLQTGQKHMELMVVADNEMRKYHKDNLESYVMTILNIVARRFVDDSLDANLRIHLVKFYVLESDDVGTGTDAFPTDATFTVTNNGYTLLDDFCKWQGARNGVDDQNPSHWDNAMLITRYNLISPNDGSDSLLGRAPVGGTCRHEQQCSVNQDDGLGSALTIAHETGHTLNLKHDSAYGCPDGINIMSGLRSAGEGAFSWSMCSQTNIQEFLRNPVSNCLNDMPLMTPLPVDDLPGTIYSYEDQCELAFDSKRYTMPVDGQVDCSVLACADSNGAWQSKGIPVMEGTTCGADMWCLNGQCVQRVALPDAVDGGWSDWNEEFGPCSRTCGGGVRSRTRYCNNPRPSSGGRSCEGRSVEYLVCENTPCRKSQDDFRDEQCQATNNIPLNDVYYNWNKGYITGLTGDELCQHFCLSERFYQKREPFQFTDGTRCWQNEINDAGKLKLCVGGLCKSFGCDGIEDSGAEYDVCGVCNGGGSTCTRFSDTFTGRSNTGFTYFLTLPVGSTGVQISNTNSLYSYIALKLGADYVLQGSGNYGPSSGRYSAGSATVIYKETASSQSLTIAGPTTQEIDVEAFLLLDPTRTYVGGVNVRPDIVYEYYAPSADSGVQESFSWETSDFTTCPVSCGGGLQTRTVRCQRTINARTETVQNAMCPQPEPSQRQSCNAEMCPYAMLALWDTSAWSPCSASCGDGTRSRMVSCLRDGVQVGANLCDNTMPPAQENCNEGQCLSALPYQCNGVTSATTGLIDNIGQSTNGETCQQIVAAPPGKDITIKLVKLVIDCNTERFAVKVGLSEQRYCGYITNRVITVSSNIITIEHRTTDANSGYRLTYTLDDSATPPNPCDKVLTSATGRITSPGWSKPYKPNQMCTTTVIVKPGKKIRLKFQKFFLDGEEPYCSGDYVLISEQQEQPVIYCGTKSRFSYRSKSHMLSVTFQSDANNQMQGFKAVLKQIN